MFSKAIVAGVIVIRDTSCVEVQGDDGGGIVPVIVAPVSKRKFSTFGNKIRSFAGKVSISPYDILTTESF